MKHLKLFENKSQYDTYSQSIEAILPNVSYVAEDNLVYYNPFIDYSKEYMYFEALEDGMTVSFNNESSVSLYYSLDKQEWNELTGETPAVNSGEKVYIKLDNLDTELNNGIGRFTINKQCNVAGNIMSLLFGDNFIGKTDLTEYVSMFSSLFYNCEVLKSAKNLILPATTLANYCYNSMFNGCTGLTTAPALPATTLASSCYSNMFMGCTSLTIAPELHATELAQACYYCMFNGCTSLNYIKMLATDISASNCLGAWVYNVSPTGTFVKADGVEIPSGVSGIPSGWTVQTV